MNSNIPMFYLYFLKYLVKLEGFLYQRSVNWINYGTVLYKIKMNLKILNIICF